MLIDDPVLLAAAHLSGPGAGAVLRAALAAASGELLTARPSHVQYRPGVDAVADSSARPDSPPAEAAAPAGSSARPDSSARPASPPRSSGDGESAGDS